MPFHIRQIFYYVGIAFLVIGALAAINTLLMAIGCKKAERKDLSIQIIYIGLIAGTIMLYLAS